MLDKMDVEHIGDGAEIWEKVVRKIHGGTMPPLGMPRPDPATLDSFASSLEVSLDRAAISRPEPGRAGMHRLNRAEYPNAIRDLLALKVDVDLASSGRRREQRLRQHGRRSARCRRRCSNSICRRREPSAASRSATAASVRCRRFIRFRRLSPRPSTSKACRSAPAAES